ncbi:MAG: restriction endonuclease [Gemmataceae bacterium]|nr:restriction endonuclease [Gemmataceae bacterium]
MAQQVGRYIYPVVAALKKLGGSARPAEVYPIVALDLNLPDAVLGATRKNGTSQYENHVNWARLYLVRTGYLDKSKHGVWTLTEKGREAEPFTDEQLRGVLRQGRQTGPAGKAGAVVPVAEDPEQDLVAEDVEDDTDYRTELLLLLRTLPPGGFERLCQRLLREAGFEQVAVTGRSGDQGIDGIGVLRVNPFVTFKVLFQCKRYADSVGLPHVRDFRGAMMGRADKGLILTTGTFTAEAHREATRDGVPPIELIDGPQLVALFAELGLGLKPRTTYDLDRGFFTEFES